MDYKRIFKKTLSFLSKNLFHIMLIHLFIGYLTLFIAFIIVVIDSHSNSDWFLENFSTSYDIKPREPATTHAFYLQLLKSQEPLGKEFEKVINENLWDLYES